MKLGEILARLTGEVDRVVTKASEVAREVELPGRVMPQKGVAGGWLEPPAELVQQPDPGEIRVLEMRGGYLAVQHYPDSGRLEMFLAAPPSALKCRSPLEAPDPDEIWELRGKEAAVVLKSRRFMRRLVDMRAGSDVEVAVSNFLHDMLAPGQERPLPRGSLARRAPRKPAPAPAPVAGLEKVGGNVAVSAQEAPPEELLHEEVPSHVWEGPPPTDYEAFAAGQEERSAEPVVQDSKEGPRSCWTGRFECIKLMPGKGQDGREYKTPTLWFQDDATGKLNKWDVKGVEVERIADAMALKQGERIRIAYFGRKPVPGDKKNRQMNKYTIDRI